MIIDVNVKRIYTFIFVMDNHVETTADIVVMKRYTSTVNQKVRKAAPALPLVFVKKVASRPLPAQPPDTPKRLGLWQAILHGPSSFLQADACHDAGGVGCGRFHGHGPERPVESRVKKDNVAVNDWKDLSKFQVLGTKQHLNIWKTIQHHFFK